MSASSEEAAETAAALSKTARREAADLEVSDLLLLLRLTQEQRDACALPPAVAPASLDALLLLARALTTIDEVQLDAVNVRAMVGRKGTRFELQGGSMSLRACDFAMKPSREGRESASFSIDGVLDLTPGVDVALSARVSPDQTENTPVTIPKGFEWPWKRGEPGRKPAGDPSE